MKLSTLALLTAALFMVPGAALAEAPSSDEVKKVFDYFENGKGQGPVLLMFQTCKKVGKPSGKAKKECMDSIDGPVAKNTVVNAYTRWFVPKDDKYDDIRVQFLHEGEMRAVKDISVSTSYGYGTWKAKTLNKTGTWEIKLLRGKTELASSKITVE